jgi:SAM-dependent methyltransferase
VLRSCPVCRQPHPVRSPFSQNEWILRECPATGLLYLENPPAYAALETEFAFEVTMGQERARRRETEPLWSRLSDTMKRLRRLVFPRRNKFRGLIHQTWNACGRPAEFHVLDIGCGSGGVLADFVAEFATLGVRVVPAGIEISAELSRLARERLAEHGGQVFSLPATEGIKEFPAGRFHCALMSSYLEHETAPGEVLSALRSRLVPGGQVLIKVPNYACWNRRFRGAKWCGFRFPDHVNYFTPAALRRQVENAGLAVTRMGLRDRLPLSDNMYLVAAAPRS